MSVLLSYRRPALARPFCTAFAQRCLSVLPNPLSASQNLREILLSVPTTPTVLVSQQFRYLSSGASLGNIFTHAQNQSTKPGETLEQYGVDLTKLAKEGKLDPVIGRHEEIRRTLQILARRTKNNPVLIGEPGVGKTAIAEGLAQRIATNEVPESMKNKRVVSLDISSLVSGAMFRGQFELCLVN